MDTAISHPTMTAKQFDSALHRAMMDGCRVIATHRPGFVFVTSGTSNLTYRTSRTTCTCMAGRQEKPCKHIALAIFEVDVMGLNRRTAQPQTAA